MELAEAVVTRGVADLTLPGRPVPHLTEQMPGPIAPEREGVCDERRIEAADAVRGKDRIRSLRAGSQVKQGAPGEDADRPDLSCARLWSRAA